MEPVRLGIIGCGDHAMNSHINVALARPDLFKIVAVCDRDCLRMNAVFNKASHWVLRYDDAEDLMKDQNVDAVIIATTPASHLEYVKLAVKYGKHIFCEKPLWGTYEENETGAFVVNEAVRRGLIFTSCHPRRFEPECQRIQENLSDFVSRYGELQDLSFSFFYHKTDKAWRKEDSLLIDHMNHELDLSNFLLGTVPVSLCKVYDAHDRYRVTGIRADGVALMFTGSRKLDERLYVNELVMTFERGRVVVRMTLESENGIVLSSELEEGFDSSRRVVNGPISRSVEVPFCGIMENFAYAIRGEGENYLKTSEIIQNTIACTTLTTDGVCMVDYED